MHSATCFHIRDSDAPRFFLCRLPDGSHRNLLLLMKTLLSFGAMIAVVGLAMASASAQTQSSSTTYIETSKLVGKPVKSSQGEEIGTIKDVVIDRNTGCMAYTVLSTTGGGGGGSSARVSGGGKMVAVPWSVYSPTSDVNTYTVTVDRQRIYSAPVFDYARVEEYSRPDYINNVYSYYGVSSGAAVGVGVSGSRTTTTGATTTTGGTATTDATTTTGAATGAAAAGTSASPGAGSSPPAASSPAGGKSPMPATSASPGTSESPRAARTPRARGARPHDTVSPGTHGEETATSPTEEKRGTKGRHERTTSPSGQSGQSDTGARSQSEHATAEGEHSKPEASNPSEKATGSQHHEKAKHEATSPSEKSPGD